MPNIHDENCPVGVVLRILGGKWKLSILCALLDGTKRFSELRRLNPGITQRMLTNQLRELEADLVVTRKIYAEVPPKVEYSLTEVGKKLQPILQQLEEWGRIYLLDTSATS
ncbi:MAG: helix-turn-helix transcriptional regulator [Burkholderiales bacterium]|nr:helix-turn-helix transcriptional regulator [Burkholderiales bacterium]MBP9768899.1 helix-turn-helix transcriptional regulator [Burkholderiales bacterium]